MNCLGCFIPVKFNNFAHIEISVDSNAGMYQNINANGPFFHIENENGAVDSFLHALFNSSTDEARNFVCSNSDDLLDLDAFKKYFGSNVHYKYLSDGNFNLNSKNIIVKSVLFMDKKHKRESIINFYLINQPDKFSKLKIYAIM